MNRPIHTWIIFGICLAIVLAAVGWMSVTTVRLDRSQMAAVEQAELEEKVRLALWRMDSWLMPLFIEESARPASAYEAFYGVRQAFNKGDNTIVNPGDVVLPSPLLNFNSSNILLHFQYSLDRRLTSPQVPSGQQIQLAQQDDLSDEHLGLYRERLAALQRYLELPAQEAPPPAVPNGPASEAWVQSLSQVELPQAAQQAAVGLNNGDLLIRETPIESLVVNYYVMNQAPAQAIPNPYQMEQQRLDNSAQIARNDQEFNVRGNVFQSVGKIAPQNFNNQVAAQQASQPTAQQTKDISAMLSRSPEGIFKALWVGDELFLARRAMMSGGMSVQGCWLSWTNIRKSLIGAVQDLLPNADLRPVKGENGDPASRMLAAVPARLLPGLEPSGTLVGWSPVRRSLALAWVGMLIAGLAAALLLHGTLALSERRAAFVSAVTHELRTPLTTFKMYSEMLAEGMVRDEAKQRHYLNTLCSEANRLSHLVENVLAYARLERGSARRSVERIALRDLIRRVESRLKERTERARMTLEVEADATALDTLVHVDVSVVEQILFNLVDNACKYAAPDAAEKVIHLEAFPAPGNGKYAMVRIRDHGQGISAEGARRLFKPFCKSAHEAAHTAPGVGLGLALCRRLSRSLGGDLRWIASVRDGACFELSLPLGQPE